MDDEIETLMVDVRASTAGFKNDIDAMRATVDATLVDGFATAGNVLERGLLSAIRRGRLGFEDLKRVALSAMDRISTQAMQGGMASLFAAPAQSGGLGSVLGGAMGALLGLPGRATGGPVSPGTAYRVGERGPELFVPTSSGRIETTGAPSGRDVRVSIHLGPAKGADAPTALRRSARQVASSVRRALQEI
jgi:hypothetical protein